MTDKTSTLQIIGSLMKHPQYLSESDKYMLTPDDFYSKFEKYLFLAIENLYTDGAKRITPIDVENYLETNEVGKTIFKQNNGIEYLQDAEYLSEEQNFPYYYKKLKKFNVLRSLQRSGFDIKDFYIEDLLNPKALETNARFEQLEIRDILDDVRKKLLKVEKTYAQGDTTEVQNVFTNIQEILDDAAERNDVGFPIQGKIFNEVLAGARKGALCIRSGGSGVSKTRQSVGDACYLAFPFRFDEKTWSWVAEGGNQKVLFIATEQNFKEIQKMILAYLTGFNETKFRYGDFTEDERRILRQAMWVLDAYQDNFHIVRMPNPTIELVKMTVRENVLTKNIEYVFYDYVFIGPSLLQEFKGFNLRNDEVLLMFATALKDLAVELNVFVMTSTQVNANADENKNIRNESSLAGSRSIINKADVGAIMARPSKEELDILKSSIEKICVTPNIVTDIYKVRSGEWNQVRIWSYVDLGNLRKEDLFITDSRLDVLEQFNTTTNYVVNWEAEEQVRLTEELINLNKIK